LCNRAAERIGLHVVREAAAAVDLDNGQPLPMRGFERRVARDLDLAEIEAELELQLPDHFARAIAEVAARRMVENDVGSTDRCPA
jgi:hypothetical protein